VKLLLDTHALIWILREPDRLASKALRAVRDPRNELYVSAITPFEMSTKHRRGKLPQVEEIVLAYDDHLRKLGARDLPVTAHHSLVAGSIPSEHGDPFDRILAAQAITESMILVTSDTAFASFGGVRTLWG
jgi:PIN domain nuclease of toxin-antitoxin system